LRHFLMTSLRDNQLDGFHEAVSLAKQCITDLNVNMVPERLTEEELIVGPDMIPVQVMLIDNTTRKVRIAPSASLQQLGERVAESLKIHRPRDFCFFQITDGIMAHRLMPEQTVLSDVLKSWGSTEKHRRTSHLLWKRRFIRLDETLQAGDLTHATLTYRQLLWDFRQYPIHEDAKLICDIAAALLFVDREHYKDLLRDNMLEEPNALEQVLPSEALPQQKRSKWATMVTEAYLRLEQLLDPQETRLQQMSRVVSLMQQMKLFGAYFWRGTQAYAMPKDMQGLKDPPSLMCRINPKEPKAEYWICLDLFGVRFVSDRHGVEFQRSFQFNEEAIERVLSWGATKDVVQFVVQTVNPALPAAGRVPMSIVLSTPAAVDIVWVAQSISKVRNQARSFVLPN